MKKTIMAFLGLCLLTIVSSCGGGGGGGSSSAAPVTGGDGYPIVSGQYIRNVPPATLTCTGGKKVPTNAISEVVTISQDGSTLTGAGSTILPSSAIILSQSSSYTLRTDASFVGAVNLRYSTPTDGTVTLNGVDTGQFYDDKWEGNLAANYLFEDFGLSCSGALSYSGDKV